MRCLTVNEYVVTILFVIITDLPFLRVLYTRSKANEVINRFVTHCQYVI